MTPLGLFRVPPEMVALATRMTLPPLALTCPPDPWVRVIPLIVSPPPLVASIRLLLVMLLVSRVIVWPLALASMVLLLVMAAAISP